jgi:hypothetical protein
MFVEVAVRRRPVTRRLAGELVARNTAVAFLVPFWSWFCMVWARLGVTYASTSSRSSK